MNAKECRFLIVLTISDECVAQGSADMLVSLIAAITSSPTN